MHGFLESEVSIELSNFKLNVVHAQADKKLNKEVKYLRKYFSVPLHFIYRVEKKSSQQDMI